MNILLSQRVTQPILKRILIRICAKRCFTLPHEMHTYLLGFFPVSSLLSFTPFPQPSVDIIASSLFLQSEVRLFLPYDSYLLVSYFPQEGECVQFQQYLGAFCLC